MKSSGYDYHLNDAGQWVRSEPTRDPRNFLILALALVLAVLGWYCEGIDDRYPTAHWDGSRWSCPLGYEVVADEHAARASNPDFVGCR